MSEEDLAVSGTADEIMTLMEIARYLKVSEKTILRMIQNHEIPAAKVSNQWRFQRAVVDNWLSERMGTVSEESLARVVGSRHKDVLPVPTLLTPTRVVMEIEPGSKEDVIRQLVAPLVDEGVVSDGARYVQALIDRERTVSTGIADGVALPHAHDPEAGYTRERCMIFGLCRPGTDFDSLDGQPTHLFFLLGATSASSHLHLMAKVALMLRISGISDDLRKARSRQEVTTVFMRAHQEISMRL